MAEKREGHGFVVEILETVLCGCASDSNGGGGSGSGLKGGTDGKDDGGNVSKKIHCGKQVLIISTVINTGILHSTYFSLLEKLNEELTRKIMC